MTDSIKLFISVEHVDATEDDIDSLPFHVDQTINQDGEVLSSTPKPQWIESKLKAAQSIKGSSISDHPRFSKQ